MKNSIKYAAVIFDMDGLMLDTETVAQQNWYNAFEHFGYSISQDDYFKLIGRTLKDNKKILFEVFGNDFPFDRVLVYKSKLFKEHILKNGIGVKEGLFELLNYLDQQHIPKAIASSSSLENVRKKLLQTDLLSRFDAIKGGDEIKNGKPSPEIFEKAADELKTPYHQCIVLEDSDYGIKAATTAGMIPILVPDIKPASNDSKKLAFKVFNSLIEVVSFLKSLE